MLTLILIPFILSIFLAINMGASGTAPSFAAAYGAGLIKKELIPGLFGLMVFAGAILAGEQVSLTMGKGLLDSHYFTVVLTSVILLSVGLSLLFANLLGIPQSTSQTSVLSIAGAASYLQGLNTHKLFVEIIPTWFIMPLISFALMYIAAKWIFPMVSRRVMKETFLQVRTDRRMKWLVLLSCLYVAFAIGAQNVANAAGPVSSMILNELKLDPSGPSFNFVVLIAMLIVAPCFSIGSSLMGGKLLQTTGKEIIRVGPFAATVISMLTASLLLLTAVVRGIPTSLVQLNAGAFIAFSICKIGSRQTFSNPKVRRLFTVWLIAPIFAFTFSYFLTMLAEYLGLL